MLALALAYALATEWSEAAPPRPAKAVATASLLVADFYAVSTLAPIRAAPVARPAAGPLSAISTDTLILDESGPALIRIMGRADQIYRVRIHPLNTPDWNFQDVSIVSQVSGDVTDSGAAVMNSDGLDVLRITGVLMRVQQDAPPFAGDAGPVLAAFAIHYE